MSVPYLFTSERLGFRNWQASDLPAMAAMNTDAEVMRYFPTVKSYEETRHFIERMQQQMADRGFCYFAVDRLDTGAFIGFIGLSEQTFPSPFTPYYDVGWRLHPAAWNKGFATEGARRCLQYGFETLGMAEICAVAPVINQPSVHVMEKAGMQKIMEFAHPLLTGNERLELCVLYKATKTGSLLPHVQE